MESKEKIVIKIDCPDELGLVYRITNTINAHKLNIISLQEHVEAEDNHFFSRIEVSPFIHSQTIHKTLLQEFQKTLPKHAKISIHDGNEKKNIVIMTSTEYHCLNEIIVRSKFDRLPAQILSIIGNHQTSTITDLCSLAEVPFYYIPSPKDLLREEHERLILAKLAEFKNVDYIILARYMRILSADFIKPYQDRIINIHHSFLPAFIGANPYKQACDRGVKLIGATAHFVTENLDEGPIISQDVRPITHSMTVDDLKSMGRDIEKITLSNALSHVFENKVFVSKNKTIVFL